MVQVQSFEGVPTFSWAAHMHVPVGVLMYVNIISDTPYMERTPRRFFGHNSAQWTIYVHIYELFHAFPYIFPTRIPLIVGIYNKKYHIDR